MGDVEPMDIDVTINEKFIKNGAKKREEKLIIRFPNIAYTFNENRKEEEGTACMNRSFVTFYRREPFKMRTVKTYNYPSSMARLSSSDTYDDEGDIIIFKRRNGDFSHKIRFPTAKSKARFIRCYEMRKKEAIKKDKESALAVQEVADVKSEECSETHKKRSFVLGKLFEIAFSRGRTVDKSKNIQNSSTSDAKMINQIEGEEHKFSSTEEQKKIDDELLNTVQLIAKYIKEDLLTQNVPTDMAIKLSQNAEKQLLLKPSESFETDVSSIVKSNLPEADLLSENQDGEKSQISNTETGEIFPLFKDFENSKNLQSILEKMKNCLITKNVPIDVVVKLCESVETNMEGKAFECIPSVVKSALIESLEQILKSNCEHLHILQKCIDIQILASRLFLIDRFSFTSVALASTEDVFEVFKKFRPYVLTLCGVNGVGKSTSLAKICHWLLKNNLRVLIASCDTVKDGASDELQTHVKNLNDLHPPQIYGGPLRVQFHKGIMGKDPTKTAMTAIKFATSNKIDVVLIDTAGRMPDNQPLMRDLTIFIKVTAPDLLLFVADAGTGSEAIKQFDQFNQALAASKCVKNSRGINGIVLTKFETINDKVGAALSMIYSTGKPIVFVGTGQTYNDLKAISAESIANSLIK